ncbi:MAG: hypothetical protein ACKOC8_08725 [Pirellulales bacterium]
MSPTNRFSPVKPLATAVPSVVVVDPHFEAYAALVAGARLGSYTLHLRSSGAEAMKLARRISVDAWLVAAELDDMAGEDLLEVLRGSSSHATLAIISDTATGRRGTIAASDAEEAGADALLSHPISLADLQDLLGLPAEERARRLGPAAARRSLVTLPVGVGAAVIAIAVLMMG